MSSVRYAHCQKACREVARRAATSEHFARNLFTIMRLKSVTTVIQKVGF